LDLGGNKEIEVEDWLVGGLAGRSFDINKVIGIQFLCGAELKMPANPWFTMHENRSSGVYFPQATARQAELTMQHNLAFQHRTTVNHYLWVVEGLPVQRI
jgi:hypothetical protein